MACPNPPCETEAIVSQISPTVYLVKYVCRLPKQPRDRPYTKAERQLKIAHYREKCSRRTYDKHYTYECRSRVAKSRPRIHGRFIPKVVPVTPPNPPSAT